MTEAITSATQAAEVSVPDILLRRSPCEPLSADELTLGVQEGLTASRHLAATVVLHCAGVRRTSSNPLGHLGRRPSIIPQQTTGARLTSPDDFYAILTQVGNYADRFDTVYAENGKIINFEALVRLYDRTDALNHPSLTALPSASTVEDVRRRNAVVGADRLLRFMLDETFSNQPQIQ